jgi:Uma2 family endonuclease
MSLAELPARPKTLMTAEEFLALPDDGVERDLIRGVVRERPSEWTPGKSQGRPITYRNRHHSGVEARITAALIIWLYTQPEPRGQIHCGEVGFRLRRDPDTVVGIDLAYASAALVAATGPESAIFDGAPVLAVEILSPSDQVKDIAERIGIYLEVGTVVWVVNPYLRTVSVHRKGAEPETFNATQELSGGPELPGFRVKVAEFFS